MRQETIELIRKVIHQNREFARLKLDSLGLYRGQPKLIYILCKEDGLTKKELAGRLDVAAPTITKMVERLEKNDFVYTKKDEKDKRITRVYVSDKGKVVQKELVDFFNESKEVYFKDMTDTEVETLYTLLTKISKNVEENIKQNSKGKNRKKNCCGGSCK
tara:strand:+ start:124 stop:603 length:480 start_codon:yes stop_codon:yes gene_type:complete